MASADLYLLLDELLEALGAEGLRPGVDAHLRVLRYAEAMARRTEQPSADAVKYQLAALLTRSPEEQARFYEVFEKFIRPYIEPAGRDAGVETAPPLPIPPLSLPPDPLPPVSGSPKPDRRPPTKTSGRSGPIRIDLTFPGQNFRPWNTADMDHATRPLREKEWTDVLEWDIRRSIRATMRAGGVPQFATRRRKKAPQYLLLIDQRSPRDHLAGLYADLAAELRRHDLDVDFYYYTATPYRCWRDPRDPHTYTTIESLQSEYAGCKLLLVGEVDGLLELPDLRPSNLAFDLHDQWREVALLCPKSTAEWGEAERTLCPLFPIVPANATGLSTLVRQWQATEVYTPAYWQVAYPEPALPPVAPDHEAGWEPVLEGLYYYLGEQGFQWLCAAAVYPELYWELTKLLHDESIPPSRDLTEGDQNRQWQVALQRLSRVGWFRQGHLPTPVRTLLRQHFERQLPPKQRRDIRDQLLAVLGMAENQPPPDSYAAADRAFTIAWYEYERALAAPHLSEAERIRIEAEFREKGLAKIALTDIEDAIGRKLFEEIHAAPVWPGVPEEPGFHVLWVDDEPKNNERFQEELNELMHVITTNVRSTGEALTTLAERGFDLIISDVSRHRRDDEGTKMLQVFREKGVPTPVVFYTTAYLVEKRSAELMALGALGVFGSRRAVEALVGERVRGKNSGNNIPAESPVDPSIASPSAKFQLLWVDDFPNNNTELIEDFSSRMEMAVTLALSTEEALEKLANGKFDAVISDLGRGADHEAGLKMLELFKQKNITLPVAIFAIRTEQYKEAMLQAGAQLATNRGDVLAEWVTGVYGKWLPTAVPNVANEAPSTDTGYLVYRLPARMAVGEKYTCLVRIAATKDLLYRDWGGHAEEEEVVVDLFLATHVEVALEERPALESYAGMPDQNGILVIQEQSMRGRQFEAATYLQWEFELEAVEEGESLLDLYFTIIQSSRQRSTVNYFKRISIFPPDASRITSRRGKGRPKTFLETAPEAEEPARMPPANSAPLATMPVMVRNMVAEGDLEQALLVLSEFVEKNYTNSKQTQRIRLKQAEFYQNKNEVIKGTISSENARLVDRGIAVTVLEIVDQIEQGKIENPSTGFFSAIRKFFTGS